MGLAMTKFKKYVLMDPDEDVNRPMYHDYTQRHDNVDEKRVQSLEKQIEATQSLPLDIQKRIVNDRIQTLLDLNKELKGSPALPPPEALPPPVTVKAERPKSLPARKRKRTESGIAQDPTEVKIFQRK